jgi:hypothetical protein
LRHFLRAEKSWGLNRVCCSNWTALKVIGGEERMDKRKKEKMRVAFSDLSQGEYGVKCRHLTF